MKDFVYKKRFTFLCGTLVGLILFIYLYGIDVLNVTNDQWLLSGGDLSQHYLGWKFFRNSTFSFPLGLSDTIAYPHKMSIVYTDSIPILAIFFKLLSPILPETFQYFGIHALFCLMMQGGLGALIIRKITSNNLICLGGSILFILTPSMLSRMFTHTALASHYLLLLIFVIWFYKDEYFHSTKKLTITFALVGGLIVSIHMYLLAMAGIILCGLLLCDLIENKNILRCITIVSSFIVTSFIIFFLIGGFYGDFSSAAYGVDAFTANLNTLINPMIYSSFFEILPLYKTTQYEGAAYLGLGQIVLLLFSIISVITVFFIRKIKHLSNNKLNFSYCFSICMVVIVSFFLAVGPDISINEHLLLHIPYPDRLIMLWSIFRSTGRFIWILVYILIGLSIVLLVKTHKKYISYIVIILCIVLQIADLNGYNNTKKASVNSNSFSSVLTSDEWNILSSKGYKHIVFISYADIRNDLSNLYSFSIYATDNNMTINNFYFARSIDELFNSDKETTLQNLTNNIIDDSSIYIFNTTDALSKYNLYYYNINGFIVGLKNKCVELNNYLYTNTL